MNAHPDGFALGASRARASMPPAPSAVSCMCVLVIVKLALRVVGFARTIRSIEWLTRRQRGIGRAAPDFVHAADRVVAIAAALYPGRALCLEQSLVLHYVLRRGGVESTLRIGVHPYPFSAHAWVECGGEPVNDIREHTRTYTPLPNLPDGR